MHHRSTADLAGQPHGPSSVCHPSTSWLPVLLGQRAIPAEFLSHALLPRRLRRHPSRGRRIPSRLANLQLAQPPPTGLADFVDARGPSPEPVVACRPNIGSTRESDPPFVWSHGRGGGSRSSGRSRRRRASGLALPKRHDDSGHG
jgi:hypothetical protein